MSDDDQFVWTFPVYMVLTKRGNPESVIVEGNRALCLFTDHYLIEDFYKEKYGSNFTVRPVDVMAFADATTLLETLKDWQAGLRLENVGYLALDLTPGKKIAFATVQDVIDDLAKQ